MNIAEAWNLAKFNETVSIESLDKKTGECVINGDGLYDHYGGRSNFSLIAAEGIKVLAAEKISSNEARFFQLLNCTGGYGAGVLGGDLSFLNEEVKSSIGNMLTINDEHHSIERMELVKKIKRLVASHTLSNPCLWEVSFTSTGTEAVDLALQISLSNGYNLLSNKKDKEKNVVVACHGAWHGWAIGANQLIDRKQFTGGIPRLEDYEVVFMHYGDLQSLRKTFDQYGGRIKCVITEGVLGDGGIIEADQSWWEELSFLSNKEKAILIDDEILTGLRTGAFLASPLGITPDCITLGKGLGFGLFPISAVIWRNDILKPRPGLGIRTFNARPFQSKVVNSCINFIETNDLFSNANSAGNFLKSGLLELKNEFPNIVKDIRGKGLLLGIELSRKYARKGQIVRDSLLRHGVLSEVESGMMSTSIPKDKRVHETLRITPPINISYAEQEEVLKSFKFCFQSLDGSAS